MTSRKSVSFDRKKWTISAGSTPAAAAIERMVARSYPTSANALRVAEAIASRAAFVASRAPGRAESRRNAEPSAAPASSFEAA